MPELLNAATALIAQATDQLRQAGLSTARRDALQLWADLQGTTVASVLLRSDAGADRDVAVEFLDRVNRRAGGEPLAYVSGSTGFRRLTLACDARALIPRPETEGLVELLLARIRTGRVADIGTGTGCLALSLAVEGAFGEVVAVDWSAAALALAQRNRTAVSDEYDAAASVQLVRGDLSAPLRSGAFDALVANPPYLSEVEYAAVDRSVRDWEPAAALVSGADGLEATTRLFDDARRVLRPGGWFAIEVDCSRAAQSVRRAVEFGWSDVAVYNDLFGRERYLLARRSEIS